jgi:hypothetical protein
VWDPTNCNDPATTATTTSSDVYGSTTTINHATPLDLFCFNDHDDNSFHFNDCNETTQTHQQPPLTTDATMTKYQDDTLYPSPLRLMEINSNTTCSMPVSPTDNDTQLSPHVQSAVVAYDLFASTFSPAFSPYSSTSSSHGINLFEQVRFDIEELPKISLPSCGH